MFNFVQWVLLLGMCWRSGKNLSSNMLENWGVPLLAVQHLLALVYVRKFPSLQSVRSTTSRGGGISCAVQQQNHPAAHKAACNLVNFLQKLQLSMCLQIRSAALLHSGQRG